MDVRKESRSPADRIPTGISPSETAGSAGETSSSDASDLGHAPVVRLDVPACRSRFASARRAVLATATPQAVPHLVPVTFALLSTADADTSDTGDPAGTAGTGAGAGATGDVRALTRPDVLVHAVDAKPKSTTRLRRLGLVTANPRVALLADGYDDHDWTRLWWVRADARADVVDGGARWQRAIVALAARYPQYATTPPSGAVIWAVVERWSGWAAGPSSS